MEWSWRVGKIRGIDIKIHFTFVFALIWGARAWGDGAGGAAYGVALTLGLFAFVLLHELGHALAALRYGIRVHDIVLLPIGGLARLSRMPETPRHELVVALAGPAVNVALMLLTLPIIGADLAMGGRVMAGEITRPGLMNFVWFVAVINFSLLAFNMLPAFPMDGGRVLRALLAMKLRYGRATRWAAAVGQMFAVSFGVFGLMTGNWMFAVVAVFIFLGAGAEGQDAVLRERLRDVSVTQAVEREAPVLPADLPAHVAFDRLMRSPYRVMAVVNADGEYAGMVTRSSLQQGWSQGQRGDLAHFVEQPPVRLDCAASLDDARQQMAEAESTVAPVFCGGRFTGLIDLETIGRIATMRQRGVSPAGRTPYPGEA
jgi:Zn-dependent protease